jgi:hypothetical protein
MSSKRGRLAAEVQARSPQINTMKKFQTSNVVATVAAEAVLNCGSECVSQTSGAEANASRALGVNCQARLVEMKVFRGWGHQIIGTGTFCGRGQWMDVPQSLAKVPSR